MRIHDLRHAHASWLLAGDADLQIVKERLGHGSTATEKYLHTLPEPGETARMRYPASATAAARAPSSASRGTLGA